VRRIAHHQQVYEVPTGKLVNTYPGDGIAGRSPNGTYLAAADLRKKQCKPPR
jgi:hypothetical protein